MKSLRVVLSLASIAMVACEPSAPSVDLSTVTIRERSSSREEAIQGGTVDTTSTNVIGMLVLGGQGVSICTGSLIAPNLVLTARHCVGTTGGALSSCSNAPFGTSPYSAGNFRVTMSHNAMANVNNWPNVDNSTWYGVSQVILAPSPGNTICGGDIALLRLSTNITNVCPLVPRVDSQLSANESYTAIGFGITSPTGQTSGTRNRVTGMTTFCAGNCVAQGQTGMSDTYEWIGGAQQQKGTCEGDSGGPSLDSLGRVMGAVSRGSAEACNVTIYSGVFGHSQWIKAQAIAAATAGGYTAAAWATGGSTTVNPCAPSDAGTTGGGTGTTGGGTGSTTGGGTGTTDQCGSGEYCAAIGANGASACVTTSNGLPPSATQCSQTMACASGFSCWGNGGATGVCLRDCTGGVTPTGGGTGAGGGAATGGGTGSTGGTCPSGQQCFNASSTGDMACLTSSGGIPVGAPDCSSNGVCAAGSTCWPLSQTQGVCLVDCGTAPTGGGTGTGGGGGSAQPTDAGTGGGGGSGGAGGAGGSGSNTGFGGGFVFPTTGGGGGGSSNTSGCSCNTVDPSFLALGLLGLLRRRRSK